jgi:translation initiation factor 2 subunit 3
VPEPAQDLKCKTKLLDHVVGQEMAVTPLKMNETLMIIVGTSATTALITGIKDDQISLRLKRPLCFYPNQQIVISRRINQKWRLIGSGKIES